MRDMFPNMNLAITTEVETTTPNNEYDDLGKPRRVKPTALSDTIKNPSLTALRSFSNSCREFLAADILMRGTKAVLDGHGFAPSANLVSESRPAPQHTHGLPAPVHAHLPPRGARPPVPPRVRPAWTARGRCAYVLRPQRRIVPSPLIIFADIFLPRPSPGLGQAATHPVDGRERSSSSKLPRLPRRGPPRPQVAPRPPSR